MHNRPQLRSLFWEATLRCNAFCEFCGSRCGEHSARQLRQEELTAEEICRCFRQIAETLDPSRIMINVTGGEPLLREDLFDIMAAASGMGFPWGMVTNGSLIDRAAVERMKKAGMKTISISLDGLGEAHNRIRRIPDGYEKIRTAVALLREADFLDELQITTVVNHRNIGMLEDMYSELREWGIDTWRLATVDPIGRARDQQALLLTRQEIGQYLDFFRTHQFNDRMVLTTSCSHYLGKHDNLYRSHRFVCQTGRTVASILANGDIYVCPNVPRIPELIQGNVRRDHFPTVWENGFGWFRDQERQSCEKCADCAEYEVCRGDSLHTWDFDSHEPLLCWQERKPEPSGLPNGAEAYRRKLKAFYPDMKGIRVSYDSSSGTTLILTPPATRQLLTYFEWGETSPRNCFELLVGLAGFAEGDLIVVEQIIPGSLEARSETTAAFSERDYRGLVQELEVLNAGRSLCHEKYRLGGQYALVGIAHSHPMELSAALSVPDIGLHGQMQKQGAFVSLLLNPQKKQIAAYCDSVFTPIDMELLVRNAYEAQDF